MCERLDVEGGAYGQRPDTATPLPNQADDAWEQLQQLRVEARDLGIDVDDAWPLARLREAVAAAKTDD